MALLPALFIMSLMGHVKYWADKLAVETEPGLTSAQLMVRTK